MKLAEIVVVGVILGALAAVGAVGGGIARETAQTTEAKTTISKYAIDLKESQHLGQSPPPAPKSAQFNYDKIASQKGVLVVAKNNKSKAQIFAFIGQNGGIEFCKIPNQCLK